MKLSIKKVSTFIAAATFSCAISAQTINASQDPNIETNTRAFLKVLNSGTGKPLEQMSPKDARLVLVGAQAA